MTSPPLIYGWRADGGDHELRLIHVPGTAGKPYLFGAARTRPEIEISDFYIGATPVTQALWLHVMGEMPSARGELCAPVENVSWHHVTAPGGFLERLNDSAARASIAASHPSLTFRLPSETEWEYAARGGPRWTDGFAFSGSNEPDDVAWYGPRWSKLDGFISSVLGPGPGWRFANLRRPRWPTRTHAVASKKPNQLGIYDMSGNVWEWCEDVCTDDINAVPRDGRPYLGPGDERRLRGGCHHNWDLHCTVSWRYGITPDAHDGCIGLRLVLARG